MSLPAHKTKIVATVGPASESPAMLEAMIRAGMSIARLNFSHGTFADHARVAAALRVAAAAVGRDIAIMADLPGPKMRVGELTTDRVDLVAGATLTLTTDAIVGDAQRVAVSFARLPQVVRPGDRLFLNDGIIQLEVEHSAGTDVRCRVLVGGELRARKGLNLPGIDLGIGAFTEHDRACLQWALEQGVDAVSQSFVESGADVQAVRAAARALGKEPFIIAKIERARALDRVDDILAAADGLMVARGDLGVEVPIEQIAILQKSLVRQAARAGKPVIIATQMLESMTTSRQPTRAEATDVANAILDGTDCVMLSAESATGKFPVDAVATLARIAAATEPQRTRTQLWEYLKTLPRDANLGLVDLISLGVEAVIEHGHVAAVVVPAESGATARATARFRLPVWIGAPSTSVAVCRSLQFSYGVEPLPMPGGHDWSAFTRAWVAEKELAGRLAVLVRGPSGTAGDTNYHLELVPLGGR